MTAGAVVVIGGTSGIGRLLATEYAAEGRKVVISGRDIKRSQEIAAEIGGDTGAVGVDLAEPETIAAALADVGPVAHLAIAAVERDVNSILDYDKERAERLVVLKLVGYPEVVHVLRTRMSPDSSIVLFGGLAKE
jgi:short-subunit dehydrogenase